MFKELFLQDVDSSQNKKKVFEKIGCTVLPMPPRSPDINPIENVFAIKKGIKRKSEKFPKRIKAARSY